MNLNDIKKSFKNMKFDDPDTWFFLSYFVQAVLVAAGWLAIGVIIVTRWLLD